MVALVFASYPSGSLPMTPWNWLITSNFTAGDPHKNVQKEYLE